MFACLIVSFYFYLVFLGLDRSQKGGRGRRDFTFLTTNSDVVDDFHLFHYQDAAGTKCGSIYGTVHKIRKHIFLSFLIAFV